MSCVFECSYADDYVQRIYPDGMALYHEVFRIGVTLKSF